MSSSAPFNVVRGMRSNVSRATNDSGLVRGPSSRFTSQTQNQLALLDKYKQNSSHILSKMTTLKQNAKNRKGASKERLERMNWTQEYKRLCQSALEIEHWLEEKYDILEESLNSVESDASSGASLCKSEQQIKSLALMQLAQPNREGSEYLESTRDIVAYLKSISDETLEPEILKLSSEIEQLYQSSNQFNSAKDTLMDFESISMEISNVIPVDIQYETDSSLRDQSIHLMYCYDFEFADRLSQEKEQYRSQCEELFGQNADFGAKNFHGFWSESDHAHYVKLYRQFKANGTLTTQYKNITFLEQCLKEMPHKSRSEIEMHDRWFSQLYTFHKQRISTLKKTYRESIRPKLLESLCQALRYAQDLEKLEEQKRKEIFQLAMEKQKREEKLDKLRQEKAVELEKQIMEQKELLKQQQERDEKRAEKELQERLDQKQKLIRYKEEERKRKLEMEQNQQLEKKELEKMQLEQHLHNAERVAYRNAMTQLAQEKKYEMKLAEYEQEQFKQQQLDRLRELVRQRLQLDLIDADPNRLLQPTEALVISKQTREREAKERKLSGNSRPGTSGLRGYTTEELMKDKRFKLSTILSEVGLFQQSEYAKQVVLNAKPFKQPRPDMFTSEQLNQHTNS